MYICIYIHVRTCSERASERSTAVICKMLGVQKEREMCCKCSNYVEESERRGVVFCKVLGVHRERERCAVSA